MTDLAMRLRNRAYKWSQKRMMEGTDDLLLEAADRIEQIQKRLADCVAWMDTREEAQSGMPRICDMARDALSTTRACNSTAPDRIWAWCFNSNKHGGWDKWGGYARTENRRPMDNKERETGAEYIRADIHTKQLSDADNSKVDVADKKKSSNPGGGHGC